MRSDAESRLKIRRALLTVSDKEGVVELARALAASGTELVATGRTAAVLKEAGLQVVPIERISGSPEAFRGRMKTLSFAVCSGILYRRQDAGDEADREKLKIPPIDCVVVNFYPFEATAAKPGISRPELIEEIDIGGPTLVRAAAKNSPDVLVLTDPSQYGEIVRELSAEGTVSHSRALSCAATAWEKIRRYDVAIARELGDAGRENSTRQLRYGENPHQRARLEILPDGPIAWPAAGGGLTPNELSYNNVLDVSACYGLAGDLALLGQDRATGAVVVKHNNPCGVALIPKSFPGAQKAALMRAWEGDAVSAFGGVVMLTEPLEMGTAEWLADRFIEVIAAPGLTQESPAFQCLLSKRKKLKAVAVRRFGDLPQELSVAVPGGRLFQSTDTGPGTGVTEPLRTVTKREFPADKEALARFGIVVCRALKSNALAVVREIPGVAGSLQLVGAGQGQPNRVEALNRLAVPRAQAVLKETGGALRDCVLVSDAFFPFRDTVDSAYVAGLRLIVQPGGSIKDADSIAACDEHQIAMAFTGVRHFKH